MTRTPLVLIILFVSSCALGQLSDSEKLGLDQALYVGNMSFRDLEWARDAYPSAHKLAFVTDALAKPLDAADRLMALHHRAIKMSPGALLSLIDRQILADPPPSKMTLPDSGRVPESVPAALRRPIYDIARGVATATERVRLALRDLSPTEKRRLIEGLPQMAAGPSVKFDFVKTKPEDPKELLGLLDKVDLAGIRAAGEDLLTSTAGAIASLRVAAKGSTFRGRIKTRIAGISVSIYGVAGELHDDLDSVLTIDLGGNDRYSGRYGVGICSCSVLIDLGGNDTYDVGDLSAGAGLLGCGLVYDLGGNDTCSGGSLTFGAGLAGVGAFINVLGNDSYDSAALTQGFGMFGVGLCLDSEGRDRYQAGNLCQGAARCGGVGWLIDRAGDDIYRAGGLVRSPILKDAYLSQAQGFGSGFSNDALGGGVGLLTDGEGNDVYVADAYAQASANWYGIGSLYDEAGQDIYSAYHYGQACAMSASAAYLFDLSGDDCYSLRQGAGQALGHDLGVALLLDRAGDDQYTSLSARPGSGNAGGLGILLESGGDDRYMGAPAFGGIAGIGGGVGVFADISGQDRYSEGLADSAAEVRNGWAVAIDSEQRRTDAEPHIPAARIRPAPGSHPLPPDAQLESLYLKALRSDAAIDEWIAIGNPGLQWLLDKKLASAGGSDLRVFEDVVSALGDSGRTMIAARVGGENLGQVRAALEIVSDLRIKEAAPFIPGALRKPGMQKEAARAAGLVGSRESVTDLLALAASPDRSLAFESLSALVRLADPQSVSTGLALLGSSDLMIRRAAIDLVAQFPVDAISTGARMIAGSDERLARIGIELLGRAGTIEALRQIGPALSDSRVGVRIQALTELSGRVPADLRDKVMALRQDSNSLVRSVAERVRM